MATRTAYAPTTQEREQVARLLAEGDRPRLVAGGSSVELSPALASLLLDAVEEVLSIQEAAREADEPVAGFQERIEAGELTATVRSGETVLRRSDLDLYLDQRDRERRRLLSQLFDGTDEDGAEDR